MIDLGLSKIAIIGVVALVVIGPEKLPKVARMAGTLYGRAQRYLHDVKSEVSREIELDELRNLQKEVQDSAAVVQARRRAVDAPECVDEVRNAVAAAGTTTLPADDPLHRSPTHRPTSSARRKRLPAQEAGAHLGRAGLVQAPQRPQDPRHFRRRPRAPSSAPQAVANPPSSFF